MEERLKNMTNIFKFLTGQERDSVFQLVIQGQHNNTQCRKCIKDRKHDFFLNRRTQKFWNSNGVLTCTLSSEIYILLLSSWKEIFISEVLLRSSGFLMVSNNNNSENNSHLNILTLEYRKTTFFSEFDKIFV